MIRTCLPETQQCTPTSAHVVTNSSRMLSFGGSQQLSNSSANLGFQATNQLSWFSSNNKHRLKFTSDLRYDAVSQDQTNNLLGTFTFNSLSDLAAGRPSQFTRQLTRRERESGLLTAGFSLGDSWRKNSNIGRSSCMEIF